jgi:hypothetical protein
MPTMVLWTTRYPDPLSNELSALGFTVWEALALSEVTYLCETQKVDIVIIAPRVDEQRAAAIRQRVTTIKLHAGLTSDVVETLWQLFRDVKPTIQ